MDYTKVFIDNERTGSIEVNVPYLEVYIPMSYFDRTSKFAQDNGDTIRVISCLCVGLYENGKFKEYKTINLGETMDFHVYDSEVRTMLLPGMATEEKVRVLKYHKGNEIFADYIIQDISNALAFVTMVLKGKVPPTVAYDQMMEIWNKNLSLNNENLGVPAVNRELIASVQYRDRKQPTRTFASRLNSDPNATMYDYAMANMRQICQFTSTFTAITFEDFDSMVTSSVKRTKEKLPEPESPLEKIIKM